MPEYPEGYRNPKVALRKTKEYYRCSRVKAWVLWQARWQCEGCKEGAPFTDSRGMPYLEAHHIISLSAEGPDIVENCVALCPNCHREAHLGSRASQLIPLLEEAIRQRVKGRKWKS
ncbi:MAG: HNH endonuclease signature motif containing protein [Proteobacteria bacterium]|nr:HNH endonuclease signature motif containing protein [Pseudomonadota bacterium]